MRASPTPLALWSGGPDLPCHRGWSLWTKPGALASPPRLPDFCRFLRPRPGGGGRAGGWGCGWTAPNGGPAPSPARRFIRRATSSVYPSRSPPSDRELPAGRRPPTLLFRLQVLTPPLRHSPPSPAALRRLGARLIATVWRGLAGGHRPTNSIPSRTLHPSLSPCRRRRHISSSSSPLCVQHTLPHAPACEADTSQALLPRGLQGVRGGCTAFAPACTPSRQTRRCPHSAAAVPSSRFTTSRGGRTAVRHCRSFTMIDELTTATNSHPPDARSRPMNDPDQPCFVGPPSLTR